MTAINGNILQWYKKARKFEKIISISVLDNPTSNYKVKEMSIINGNLITIGIDEVNNKSFIGIKGNYGYSNEYIKFEEFENTKILSLLCTDDKVIFITKTKVYTLDYNINSDSFETTFKNFPLSENLNNEIKLIGDKNNIYFYDYNKIYEINITDGNISYILSAPENSLISSITINNDKLIISRQLDNKLYIYNRTEISNNSVPVEYKIADDDVIPTLNSSTAMDLNQNVLSVGLSDGRLFIVNLDNGEESNIGSLFSEISYVDSNGSYSGFIDNEGSIIFYDRNLSKLITIEVNSRSIEGTLIGSNSKSIIDFKMDDIFLTALNNDNTVDLYKLEYIPDLEFNYHMIEKRDGKGKENDTFFLDVNAKLVSDINNAMDKTPYEVELYTNIEKSYLSGDAWANVDNFPEFVKGARPNFHRKSELYPMLSNSYSDYPNQGYWLTDTDGRLFFRTERMNLEKNPNRFSVYNAIGMDYNSNDPDNSGSININLVGKKVIVSGRWRGSRETELRFMSKVIVDGVTKALPKDNEKIKISTDWQTFSTVIDEVERGTSMVRFLPSYDSGNWETAEGFYLDQKDIKVEIVEEGESEEPTPWIPPITRKLFNPKNIFEGGNSRNPANFQGSNVETTKNVEVAEWGTKDASTFVITGGTHVIKGVMKVRLTDPPLQSDGKTFYRTNFHIRNNHETNTLTIAANGGTSVSIPPKAIGYFGTPTNQHVANNNLQFHFQVDDPSMDINCTFWNPEFYAYDIEHGFTEKAPESAGSIIYDYEYVGKFDSSLGEDKDNPNNYHWSKRKQKISTKKLYQEIGLRKNLYLPLSDINGVFASNLSLYLDSNSNDNKSSIFYKIKNINNNIEINNNEVKLDRIKKLFIKDLYKFDNDLFFRYMFICNNSYTVKLDFNNKASTLIIFNESRELYKNIFNLFNPKSEFELKVINKVGLKQYTISNLIPKGKYTIRTDYINTTSQDKDIFFTNNSEQIPDSSYNGVDMNKPLTISANEEGKLFISLKEESSGGKLLVKDLVEGKYNIYLEPTPDIDKNEIYDISNYQDPFTKFHLFKLKNVFDIINDDKFNINITLYNNGKIIETSSINNLDYREVFPNKNIKYKTSDGDIKYIEELLLTELEQGNKDRFMHNNSLVPQNRIIPNSEISISNGTYVGEEVNDEGLTGYITIPFNARDIGDLYKSDYIIMDIYVNGYKLDRKYAKERYNLNDGSLRVDYPVKNIYRFISDNEYNQISSGIIPDSVKFIATIRRKSLISSEKVIGKYRVTDQFQNDIEMLQSTGIYIPFVGKDSDLTSSELRLFIRNKVNSLARRVNPDNYTMRLDKQNKQVLVKLNGTTNIEIGSEIIIASNGLLDNNIYYINNNKDYPMDSLPLVIFDSENNMYTGLIYDEEDIDISVNGLTLIPKRDYNILDPDIDSIPSMITFKNYIPLGSTIEINYLEEKTNHVFNWDNPAYGTQNRFVLDDDRFIFVKGTFELFVNNLKLDNESFNIINNRTIEIINIEPKYLKNVMVRFSYRDHTNLKLIQDSYKFNNIDINENGYHSKFEGKSPNNFDKLSNGVSTDISKILLMNKLNTNNKLIIDCNDDNLQSDIYLDSRYIDNQYINRNISINANAINRINEDNSIDNPEI